MIKPFIILAATTLLIAACGTQTPTEQPAESYQSPLETETIAYPEPQDSPADSVYPVPITTDTSSDNFEPSYPAPAGDLETFKIIPGESQVSYEVGEVFLNQGNAFNVAVGITSEVNGEISVDRQNPQNSSVGVVRVDISQFTSDSPRRDSTIRDRFLQSSQFPIVEFTPGEIQGLPETYQEGEQISFQIMGNATIRDVTKPVTFDVTMVGNGDTITGEATTTILMSEFGFGPISIAGILNTEDEVKVKLMFVARP